jgi:hypothetical protein
LCLGTCLGTIHATALAGLERVPVTSATRMQQSVDETSHPSVSSLKSRFEQLATREVKQVSDERAAQLGLGLVRPASRERPHVLEEQKPRRSVDRSGDGTALENSG